MSQTAFEKLPCKLTPEEKERKASELAAEIDRYNETEVNKAAMARSMSDRLKTSREKINRLTRVVATGLETREVAVRYERVFESNEMRTIRLDTNETVHRRPLEAHERQEEMFARVEETGEEPSQQELDKYFGKAGPGDDEGAEPSEDDEDDEPFDDDDDEQASTSAQH